MVAERFPLHAMPPAAAASVAAAAGYGPAVVTPGAGRAEIPRWNGEAEKLTTYRFDVRMFIMSVRKNDRYICGPQLVRGLGPRVKTFAESYDKLAQLDSVSEEGECTGWEAFFAYVLEKLNLTTMQDAGLLAEHHLTKLRRNPGELPSDWIARFEKSERELLQQLKVIHKETEELMCAPLRTWWFLRRSGLTPMERGEIVSNTGGDYRYDKVTQMFLNKYPADAIAEHDKIRGPKKEDRNKAFYESDGEDDSEPVPEDETEQILALVSSGDEDEEVPQVSYEDAILQAQEATRTFKEARNVLRKMKVARDFYPVVVPRENRDPRGGRRPDRQRERMSPRNKSPHRRGQDGDSDRDHSRTKCVGCGKLGHSVKTCPQRRKSRPDTSGTTEKSNWILSLEDKEDDLKLKTLKEYSYLVRRNEIWGILDCGATRSVGGVPALEALQGVMRKIYNIESQVYPEERPTFTFGDGESRQCLGAQETPVFIAGNHQIPLKLPAIDADVPILIGMDVLHGVLQSIIDCGRGFVAFPTLAEKFWMCERLAGGHLAVCLTAPTWWTEVPKSILWAAASAHKPAEE